MVATPTIESVRRLQRPQIEARLRVCNPLPSLTRTNGSLSQMLTGEQRLTHQICDTIRRDPSLTARILQLVNSAYFGLPRPVRHVDEAVLYLGLEQVRQLMLITPVIEDFKLLAGNVPFTWRAFWQHSIATAVMSKEVMNAAGRSLEQVDYLSGLLHDVGKIVMASVFPQHFKDIQQCVAGVVQDLLEVELFVLGMDHAELGALYLQSHNVPEIFVETARHHHKPEQSSAHATPTVAAVQVADLLIRGAHIGSSGNPREVGADECFQTQGWRLLFGEERSTEWQRVRSSLNEALSRLPAMLQAMS